MNCYIFSYDSGFDYNLEAIKPEVRLETALLSYAFPTETKQVSSYIADCILKDNAELVEKYSLQPFEMKVQSLNRTFIDKIFALCDYYMTGKSQRLSRHLYDLFKLRNQVPLEDSLKNLKNEVRIHRQGLKVCPSAADSVDIYSLAKEFCENDFYKDDYVKVTEHFIYDKVNYEEAKKSFLESVEFLFK